MQHALKAVTLILILFMLVGCKQDREHPVPTTDSDRLMESYLASVQHIGELLGNCHNASDVKNVTPEVLLIVQDMRVLMPKMKAIDRKQQADTISKYRVKVNKVNEQFAKDVTQFVTIPGASEDLIKELKSLPPLIEDDTAQ